MFRMLHSQLGISTNLPEFLHPHRAFGHISGDLVVQHCHIIGMRQLPPRTPCHWQAPAGDGKARQTRAATE